jgi:heme oxygenase
MSQPGPVLSLLRAKTGDVHRRLEDRMDAIERLAFPASRDDLVQRYHQFHTAVETAMETGLTSASAGDWRRAGRVAEGLGELGLRPLPAPTLNTFGRAEALGALYVLEGSSLGGRVILKDLARRGADCRGLAFLDPHGEGVGARWRAVIELLEGEAADSAGVVSGALAAFGHAQAMLCAHKAAA